MGKPSAKALGKRKAGGPPAGNASKRAKPGAKGASAKGGAKGKDAKEPTELGPTGKPKRRADQPKKIKRRDQKTLPVPQTEFAEASDDDSDILDMDLGEDEGLEVGTAGGFLAGLDSKALSRTAKESKRIHELEKARQPVPKAEKKRAPSVASLSDISDYDFDSEVDFSDDEQGSLGSDEGDSDDDDDSDQSALNDGFDDFSSDSEDDEEDHVARRKRNKGGNEEEAEYERGGRARWAEPEEEEGDGTVEVGRLPIKLPTGEVQLVEGTTRVALPPSKKPKPAPKSDTESEAESESEASDTGVEAARMATQPGRFGRMGVAEIVTAKGWKNARRLEAAKEQMAAIGAEILAGGELIDIGPVMTRLSTFSLATVPDPEPEADGNVLPVPNSIRALSLLSQLAVYKDLIPGYRIRQLTALEEAEKVRDEVRRLREGEKILVRNYKGYLKILEAEIKRRTPLASIALRCMCDLLEAVPHFNFSENIMGVLVGRIGRRSWDNDSELILNAFVSTFRTDIAGTFSQPLVRLIARMIKERKFQVHANVLSCLLHLRLRTELSEMHVGKKNMRGKFKGKGRGPPEDKKFKSDVRKKWQTKNARKKEKEMKEIEKEMAEAEAEVDVEERSQVQTETLKNLFVLYFSILKHPGRSPLLPAALEGICHFAHLINVDFFRDLLVVLRKIIADKRTGEGGDDDAADAAELDPVGAGARVRIRMLGIVTAFDLLSGQGEALNIDLGDFVAELFALLRPLSIDTGVEDPPLLTTATAAAAARQRRAGAAKASSARPPAHTLSTAQLLFRCLDAIFFPRYFGNAAPPIRAAAFAKRMIECALFFPPDTAREAIVFVRKLAAKDARLANFLDTEERMFDGVYRPEIDDPQLTNPFTTSLYELEELERHWNTRVRAEAKRLASAKFV